MRLIATKTIIIINVLIFLIVHLLSIQNPEWTRFFYNNFGLIPNQVIYEGAIWQIISAMFIHSQGLIFHILFNMIALFSLGSFIEKKISTPIFFWLYFISGISAGIFIVTVPWIFNWTEMLSRSTIGASGAVLGLLGALYSLAPNSRLLILFFPMRVKNATYLVGGLSAILTFVDYNSIISHLGHLGGLLGGLIYTKYVIQNHIKPKKYSTTSASERNIHVQENDTQRLSDIQHSNKLQSTDLKVKPLVDNSQTDKQTSSSDVDDNASDSKQPTQKKRLLFDAKTGSFYYKE